MKNLFLFILLFSLLASAEASDYKKLPLNEIKDGAKITLTEAATWTDKVHRKDFFYKRSGQTFEPSDNGHEFSAECDYLFIEKGRLIGYSNSNLKFYEFVSDNENINKLELNPIEVASLLKDFHVIVISEFSTYTNVCKLIKGRHEEKYLILNDTDTVFEDYGFTTNNAKIERYNINGAISVTRKGLIQFSKMGDDTKDYPWYILLVR